MSEKSPCSGVMRNCSFCSFYQQEEIGDSDFGGVYAKEATCSRDMDFDDETNEMIPNFDRTIERECCILDFWKVVEIDKELREKLDIEVSEGAGSFSETYGFFKVKYEAKPTE